MKKWLGRLSQAPPNDDYVLRGLSRARKRKPPPIASAVVERILDVRDHPPENLQRTPGPLAILYYLQRDEALKAQGHALPQSTRTIWQILDRYHRILRPRTGDHEPLERPAPDEEWGIDFKDVSSVSPQLDFVHCELK